MKLHYAKDYGFLFLYEFLGTFILFVAVNFSFGNPAIVLGGVFLSCVIAGRPTGSHINFGATIGIYVLEGRFKRNLKPLLVYFASGLCGGLCGTLFCYYMLGPTLVKAVRPYNLEWSILYVMSLEFFFSWLSMTVVFHVKDPHLSIFNDMVIGVMASLVSIYFCLSCCMYLTGSVFSPTLALVNMPFIAYIQGHTAYLKFLPVNVIGGTLGGVFTAFYTKYFAIPVHIKAQRHLLLSQ